MHSPLPNSSALESGILEDERPSRLSRVQDNVRNLLRSSILGPPLQTQPNGHTGHDNTAAMSPTPPETPTRTPLPRQLQPEVLPSPTESLPSTASPTSTTSSASLHHPDEEAAGDLFPPQKYASPLERMSALFTGRAVAALNHPDVSDPSLAVLAQQKRQRRAWKRKRVSGRGNRGQARSGSGQCLLCVIAALMLASVVATCKSFCPRGHSCSACVLTDDGRLQISSSPTRPPMSPPPSTSSSSWASSWLRSCSRTP